MDSFRAVLEFSRATANGPNAHAKLLGNISLRHALAEHLEDLKAESDLFIFFWGEDVLQKLSRFFAVINAGNCASQFSVVSLWDHVLL